MKRLLAGIFLFALCSPAWAVSIGQPAPDFSLEDLGGKEVRLSNFLGRVVVLNFWASWGKNCGNQMEGLQALSAELEPKGLVVLGIDRREELPVVAAFAKAHKAAYPILVDQGVVSKYYEVNGVPDTYVIDRQGLVRRRLQGFGPQFTKELRKSLDLLLEEATSPPPEEVSNPPLPSEQKPSKIPPKLRAYAHLQLAAAYINIGDAFIKANLGDEGNYDRAIGELRQGLALDPKSVDLTAWLGVAYERKGNNERAIEYYRAALRLDSRNTYAKQARSRLGAPWAAEEPQP